MKAQTGRFRRSCNRHKTELRETLCPWNCRYPHTHDRLWCPEGHECETWGCFDSTACESHEPGLHTSCVYAVANGDRIKWLHPQFSGLAALMDKILVEREQHQSFGDEQSFVEVA